MEAFKEEYVKVAMQKGLNEEDSEIAFEAWFQLYMNFHMSEKFMDLHYKKNDKE